nr:pyridoxamine 5'-phosphate oxidase family protein [Nocardia transvalensis]
MSTAEAMRLLAGTLFGRVMFTREALPSMCLVNHLVEDDGTVVLRAGLIAPSSGVLRAGQRDVLAYEADEFDPVRYVGWSVVVVGFASVVTDSALLAGYRERLPAWGQSDTFLAIEPSTITGARLVDKSQQSAL